MIDLSQHKMPNSLLDGHFDDNHVDMKPTNPYKPFPNKAAGLNRMLIDLHERCEPFYTHTLTQTYNIYEKKKRKEIIIKKKNKKKKIKK